MRFLRCAHGAERCGVGREGDCSLPGLSCGVGTEMKTAALKSLSEAEFTSQVLEFAKLHRWRRAHFRPAMTSKGWRTPVQGDGAGFPDLVLVRGPELVIAELKVNSKVTPEQQEWLLAFGGAGAKVFVWRPKNWPEIEATLGKE